MSTAACLSARFPILTPAGTLSAGRETSRLVDGGYYENTGSATLAELIEALPEPTEALRYRLIVIQIRAMGEDHGRPTGWLGEVLSPVRAMLHTRGARGVESVARLEEIAGRERGMYVEFVLRLDRAGPPLGWLLSKDSRLRIERSVRSSAATGAGVGGTNRDAFEGVIAALR